MKKAYLFLSILAFVLSSCGPSQPPRTPTPAPADIATQVMLLLTQEPLVIPTFPPPPTLTPTPMETATPEGPTPTPTETVAPTATPTLASSDPKANLGDPTWIEKFDRDKTSFYLFDDGHTRVSLANGFLNLTSINAGNWYGWSMTSPKPRNFYLEGTFLPQTCAELDRYGLVFRAPNFDTGYFFGVSCDGKYSLRIVDQQKDLVPWTADSTILTGANQTNRLGVMAEGDHLQFYVNGKLVKELNDSTFTSDGLFGVFIASQRTPGFTVQVDEIAYWLK